MSKLSCRCGNVISDHRANLPYKMNLNVGIFSNFLKKIFDNTKNTKP